MRTGVAVAMAAALLGALALGGSVILGKSRAAVPAAARAAGQVADTAADTAAAVAKGVASGAAKAVTQAVAAAAGAASTDSAAPPPAAKAAPARVVAAGSESWDASKLSQDQVKARIASANIAESDRVALMAAFQQASGLADMQAVLDRLKQLEAAKVKN